MTTWIALWFLGAAQAAPIALTQQARLVDAAGTPVGGTHTVAAALYDAASDGTLVYSESFADVELAQGYVSVVLGDGGGLDSDDLAVPGGLWLQWSVDGQVLGDRQRLSSVPHAAVASSLSGGSVNATTVQVSDLLVLPQSSSETCTIDGSIAFDPIQGSVRVCVSGVFAPLDGYRIELANGVRTWSDGSAAVSCDAYRHPTLSNHYYEGDIGDGLYRVDPDGTGPVPPWDATCDMTTDGGGWTVLHSVTGADGQQPLVSNTEVGSDALTFGHYNTSRAKKMAIAALSSETLFLRSDGNWLRASAPAFDQSLNTANTHVHVSVTLTANNGTTASGTMGYSNYNYGSGGDFGIVSGSFDHHSTSYYHLNSSCGGHYLASYSAGSSDSDAGYEPTTALGSWSGGGGCTSGEGGSLRFRTALR